MLCDYVSSLCNSASVLAEEPSPCFREYKIDIYNIYVYPKRSLRGLAPGGEGEAEQGHRGVPQRHGAAPGPAEAPDGEVDAHAELLREGHGVAVPLRVL